MGGPIKAFVIIASLVFLVGLPLHLQVRQVSYDSYYNADLNTFFKYISDPRNFRHINPTILELTVDEQNAHSLRIRYTEYLVQMPLVRNYATAVYNIYAGNPTIWIIESFHLTCFHTDLLCLPTNSTVTVRPIRTGFVHYQEDISYSCPWFLALFCQWEVHLQRQLIMKHLARMF